MKELLVLIYWIACRAYWKNDTHCGSDYYDEADCEGNCPHADICKWQEQFEKGYKRLK